MIFRRATLFLLLLGIALGGCTDPTSIDPSVSDETWTPSIAVEFSNYRRVGVNFSNEPSLDIQRNLSRIEVQYRRTGQDEYASLETIDYRYNSSCCYNYISGPGLEEGVDYELRMKAQYQNGGTTTSNTISFTSPVVKGQRLDTIATTRRPDAFTFTEDYIYAIENIAGRRLTRIHRTTKERTVLLEDFHPPNDPGVAYERVSVHGDTLLATANPVHGEGLVLTTFDLQAQEIVDSERISPPTDGRDVPGYLIHYDGTNAHVVWRSARTAPIQVLETSTGEVVRSYPQLFHQTVERLNYDFGPFSSGYGYDGSQYWVTGFIPRDRDLRIVSMDPSSGGIGSIHQNPVFNSSGLAWGGERFWVYDSEISSLVKIKLNGI